MSDGECGHPRQFLEETGDRLPCAWRDCGAGIPSQMLVLPVRTPMLRVAYSGFSPVLARIHSAEFERREIVDNHNRTWSWWRLDSANGKWTAEADKFKRELEATRAVLQDVLEARGESWLVQLVGRREDLYGALKWAGHDDYDERHYCSGCPAGPAQWPVHSTNCGVAPLLRIVGGPVEVARQVDAAHEAALRETEWLAVPQDVRDIYEEAIEGATRYTATITEQRDE